MDQKAIVKNIPKQELERYCAMVNMDSLGLGAPQVAINISSKKLSALTAEMAARMKMPFGLGPVNGDSDSSSFLGKKIPAITIHSRPVDWVRKDHTYVRRQS